MSFKNAIFIFIIALIYALVYQNCAPYKADKNNNISSVSGQLQSSTDFVQTSSDADYTQQAVKLYRRLSGVTLPIDDQIIIRITQAIQSGDLRYAAQLAVDSKEFYSIAVRNFAGQMSNRDETSHAPLTDFVATVIGVTRDEISATELLTGNFYYRVQGLSGVSDDVKNAIVKSNTHYDKIEQNNVDLQQELIREDGQKILAESGSVVVNPDAAGLLTTRGFMEAHASGGTNRRLIEYTFKIFLCTSIDKWANTTYPDDRVGRDIGRYPISDYNNKCKGCHTGMDALRPASAYYDFIFDDDNNTGFIAYQYRYAKDPRTEDPDIIDVPVPVDEQYVPYKFRRAATSFPQGYKVKNDSWVNYADGNIFGWESSANSGNGMKDLGYLVAHSYGFRSCMVQRVFASVCKRQLTTQDSGLIAYLSEKFQNNNHNLKELFIETAIRPECMSLGY